MSYIISRVLIPPPTNTGRESRLKSSAMLCRGIPLLRLWLFLSVLVESKVALAQGPLEAARQASEEGKREYNLGHWKAAIVDFEKAYRSTGDPALIFNLAQAHRQQGDAEEALRLYRSYVREKPNGPNRAVADQKIAELQVQVWKDPFKSTPPSQPVRPTPTPNPTDAPTAEPMPSSVTADGSIAALARQPTPAGAQTSVPVKEPAEPEQSPRPAIPRWIPWTAAGLTIALAAGAIIAGTSANSRYDSLKATCGQTATGCSSDQKDSVSARDRDANILWALSGVAAAATGVIVVVNTHEAGISGLWKF